MESKENIELLNKDKNNKKESNIHVINNPNNKNINSKENNEIINFLNSLSFENLNEYYDIESNIFIKRIEKLNLKFFWTSESILNKEEIKYPYNKLFLILFKQISLYIEEIARLNKLLKLKNKNENYMKKIIAKMKEKEKENILNKQMVKNLQRNNKILEKNIDKNKHEIEKLTKKLYKNIKMDGNSLTNSLFLNNKYKNNFYISNPNNLNVSVGFDTIITQASAYSKKNNSNKLSDISILSNDNKSKKRKKISNSTDETFNDTKNKIINKGILQCDEEIENLEIIEDILINFKNKNNKYICNGMNTIRNTYNKNIYNKNISMYNKGIKKKNE
jgi:hypothetical protein